MSVARGAAKENVAKLLLELNYLEDENEKLEVQLSRLEQSHDRAVHKVTESTTKAIGKFATTQYTGFNLSKAQLAAIRKKLAADDTADDGEPPPSTDPTTPMETEPGGAGSVTGSVYGTESMGGTGSVTGSGDGTASMGGAGSVTGYTENPRYMIPPPPSWRNNRSGSSSGPYSDSDSGSDSGSSGSYSTRSGDASVDFSFNIGTDDEDEEDEEDEEEDEEEEDEEGLYPAP